MASLAAKLKNFRSHPEIWPLFGAVGAVTGFAFYSLAKDVESPTSGIALNPTARSSGEPAYQSVKTDQPEMQKVGDKMEMVKDGKIVSENKAASARR